MGDTQAIGVAFRDQDLVNSTITTPRIVAPQLDLSPLSTATTALTGSELLPVVQGGVTKQMPVASVLTAAHYAMFQDNTTQTNIGVGLVPPTGNIVTYDTIDFAVGISLVANSQITVSRAGVYDIQFSAEFSRAGGGGGLSIAEMWLAKNGAPVAETNSHISIIDNGGKAILTVNYLVQAAANDYYQLYWYSTDANVELYYIAPGTNPTRPATPSIIVTVMQVA